MGPTGSAGERVSAHMEPSLCQGPRKPRRKWLDERKRRVCKVFSPAGSEKNRKQPKLAYFYRHGRRFTTCEERRRLGKSRAPAAVSPLCRQGLFPGARWGRGVSFRQGW